MAFDHAKMRALRKAQGMRVDALAEAVGKAPTSIYAYEEGTVMPPIPAVDAIAEALGVHPIDLMVQDGWQVIVARVPMDTAAAKWLLEDVSATRPS